MRLARQLASMTAALLAACGGAGDTTSPPPAPPPPPPAAQVTVASSVPIAANYGIHDTYVRDGLAFVSAWNTGMIIYDVGNGIRAGAPGSPVEVSRIVTSADGVPGGPQVHNSWWFHDPATGTNRYLFIGQEGPGAIGTQSSGDIHVVDVSDLSAPKEVAFYHMPAVNGDSAGTHNFWMDESAGILYAAYYNGGVVALNVSGTLSGDLTSRVIATARPGTPTDSTYVWGVQLYNGSLYATDMLNGLYQLRLSGRSFVTLAGGHNVRARFSSDLWVANGYAYTGTWNTRGVIAGNVLNIWRLDASGAPQLADSLVLPGVGTVSDDEVSADGKYLLVTAERGTDAAEGLYLYSLADPVKPALLAFHAEPGPGGGLHTGTFATIGGKRYVFAARNPASPALEIYDVSAVAP